MRYKITIYFILVVVVAIISIKYIKNDNQTGESQSQSPTEAVVENYLKTNLIIEANKNSGSLSENFKPGVYDLNFGRHPMYPYDKYTRDVESGDFRITGGYEFLGDDENTFYENLKKKLVWQAGQFEKIVKDGGNVHYELASMPKWLSMCPNFSAPKSAGSDIGYGTCPPKDYEKWAKIVEVVVNYFKNERGLNVTYSVGGGEVEGLHWSDDEESFFKLYKYSVLGARRVDSNAKIGVGFLFWDSPHYYYPMEGGELKKSARGPMLKNFIQYASQTPIPELGLRRLPINYIEHHRFDMSPHVGYWQSAASGIRSWLEEFGYDKDTELFFEYSSPDSGNGASNAAAAFLASSMIDIANVHGRVWPMYNDMFPASYSQYWNVGLFNSHFNPSLSKKDYIIRPSYNVFRLFTMLRGGGLTTRISVSNNSDFLSVVSSKTKNNKQVNILVSNYVPEKVVVLNHLEFLFEKMPSMISTKDERDKIRVKCNGPTKEESQKCATLAVSNLQDPILKERIKIQAKVSACKKDATTAIMRCLEDLISATNDSVSQADIRKVIEQIKKIKTYTDYTRPVSINVSGLAFSGKAILETYIIDEDHGNSCSYNMKNGNVEYPCGKNGPIDKLIEKAKKEAQSIVSKAPLDEQQAALEALYFYGKYTTDAGILLTSNIWIDKINEDPSVSLEGSMKRKEINISDGKFETTINMSPQSVLFLAIRSK